MPPKALVIHHIHRPWEYPVNLPKPTSLPRKNPFARVLEFIKKKLHKPAVMQTTTPWLGTMDMEDYIESEEEDFDRTVSINSTRE